MKQDELLHFYQEELTLLRQLSAGFAGAHPKIASQLRISPNNIEDPQIAHLMETVALSNARIRQKLEDDFPQISDPLLQTLHPNALSPIPAMAISQFQPNKAELTIERIIPADTVLHSEPVNGLSCLFKTRYPAQLVPLEPVAARLAAKPSIAPVIPSTHNYSAVLHLNLTCTHRAAIGNKLDIQSLRFFINAPAQYAHTLYTLLFQHTTAIAIADCPTDSKPILLDPQSCLQPVGFNAEEGMLPYNKRTQMGYRLISEFFAFPEKFLFFAITGLASAISQKLSQANPQLNIYFYLKQSNPELEKKVTSEFFALGCTPIVNLFEKTAEPIPLSNTAVEYHLQPSLQHPPHAIEIYSVDKVSITDFNGATTELPPFSSLKHYRNATYYHLTRKPAWEAGHYPLRGNEVFLTFSDYLLHPYHQNQATVNTQLTCTNRDLPEQLTFTADSPGLTIKPINPDWLSKITCLTAMTPVRRPSGRWHNVSQLALNHLSFIEDKDGITNLRNLLKLYDFDQSAPHQDLLEGLLNISSHTTFLRSPPNRRGNPFWHGSEIKLVVDESKFSQGNLFLFGRILSQFFCLYTNENLFTQLVIIKDQREIYRFAPQAGYRIV